MNLLEQLEFGKRVNIYEEISNWQIMNPDKGLYVWGTGSVAAGVVKECSKHNIRLNGLFVNVTEFNLDPRIENTKLPIFQLQSLIATEKNFSVIIGHSHYEFITELEKCPEVQNIWCLTGALREDIGISEEFCKENLKQLQMTYDSLADELSRKNMTAYLNTKITGNNQYVIDTFNIPSTYFCNDVMKFISNETYLDLGAYDGKSMSEFIGLCPSFEKILAVEVQPNMYKLLQEKFNGDERITIKNIGVSDHIGVDYFNFDDQSTCLANIVSGTPVEVSTVDALCKDLSNVSLIKICIGNTITPLINGAGNVLRKYKPKLVIAAGIDSRALLDYIPLINARSGGGYQYYLRFTNAMTEAMVLYAIPI